MEKSNKIYLVIIAVCTILVVGLCAFAIINHKDEVVSDAVKFKEEYEAFNGLVNESVDKNYLEVVVDQDNPFIYKTGKEIVDILKTEDALVYFGFASCPWCRNVIEPLLSAARSKHYSKIYYVDIYDIRDSYVFNGNIIPDQTKKGTDAYYEILNILGKYLEEYYIKDDAGNMYDTGVKRLYAPSVVATRGGKVVSFHEGTIEEQKDPYVALDNKQKKELQTVYEDMIEEVIKDSCSVDGAC